MLHTAIIGVYFLRSIELDLLLKMRCTNIPHGAGSSPRVPTGSFVVAQLGFEFIAFRVTEMGDAVVVTREETSEDPEVHKLLAEYKEMYPTPSQWFREDWVVG